MTRREALALFAGWPLLIWLDRAAGAVVPAPVDEAIPPAYRASAAAHGVPAELLYAIACVESYTALGQWRARPWPWTLNVEGRAQRYATRVEVHDALVRYLRAGRRSIDVGLLQINWRYHSARLGDTWLALDPLRNLDLGATILREQFDGAGDWWLAAGRYHAPGNPVRAARYRAAVIEHVRRIQAEVLAGQRRASGGLVWTAG